MEVAVSHVSVLLLLSPANMISSEEEDPDEYPFPLTLRSKSPRGPTSPAEPAPVTANGNGAANGTS
jgi:hypothetical protein